MPIKINKIFLAKGPSEELKPKCKFCHELHILTSDNRWRCPKCGCFADTDQILKTDKKELVAKDLANPIVMSKQKLRQKPDPDLPPGANWVNQ